MKQLIGSTSWIFPGTYYENSKFIAKYVDFVELLVYTWDLETKKLLNEEINGLLELQKSGLFFTVHLPTDHIHNVVQVLDYFENSDLKILNYVAHPLEGIEKVLNVPKVSLENLKEKFVIHERMTFDIAHHVLGKKVPRAIESFCEFHMSGFDLEKQLDHMKLSEEILEYILQQLWFDIRKIPLMCFEIFFFDELLSSIEIYKSRCLI